MLQNNLEASNQKSKPIWPNTFWRIFRCIEHKQKLFPFLEEKCFQNDTGTKHRTIRTKDGSTFIIEVSSHKESFSYHDHIRQNYPVKTTINNTSKILKGLLHAYGYDASCFEDFKTCLINEHNLINVEEAVWINPRWFFLIVLSWS